ncbi:MAG: 3-phosphoshikimate 1-carboxyvinyltransferase [Candidatus Omnitrophica bacterium]|nr:3-phosphoshikimate 1-carboxyvinyltransferase [Candidatus Omnitrophota bacterium]MCM8771074.1 3-phosphoshikimate 1-carboxyvinyltransferase [Candidatus Omnitrophota bacterium]
MTFFTIKQSGYVKGKLILTGDKSITHRAFIISAITPGKTRINNPAINKDCLYTLQALKRLGIRSVKFKNHITVFGKGLSGLKPTKGPLYVGESATTMRLLAGLLVAQRFNSTLAGGRSLSRRPMGRIIEPLKLMGGDIAAREGKEKKEEFYPPLRIKGRALKGITYKLPVASAQVKSAIILASLYAEGKTKIIEPIKTRDHTERMLKLFGANINVSGRIITIKGKKELISPKVVNIPADISSASFFIVAAILLPGSELLVKSVSLNPCRIGFIKVLRRMGADITFHPASFTLCGSEPQGDILVKSSKLKGTLVKKEEIPSLIDELPILMVAACFAKGKTKFVGVEELRVKETDRINSLVSNLNQMGAKIETKIKRLKSGKRQETVIIKGIKELRGIRAKTFGDHRTAMSLIIAGLKAKGRTTLDDISCIDKSFPGFMKKLKVLLRPRL